MTHTPDRSDTTPPPAREFDMPNPFYRCREWDLPGGLKLRRVWDRTCYRIPVVYVLVSGDGREMGIYEDAFVALVALAGGKGGSK